MSFGVQGALLKTFYDSVVASVMVYGESAGAAAYGLQVERNLINLSKRPAPPLDPLQVVGESRMMDKLLSSLVDSLQVTITALASSFSDRLIHPKTKLPVVCF